MEITENSIDELVSRLQKKAHESLKKIGGYGYFEVNEETRTSIHYVHALMHLDAVRTINAQFGTKYEAGPDAVREYFNSPRPALQRD